MLNYNRIYTGDTEAFKSAVKKVVSNQVKQIPKDQREIIENTHESLISREVYFKANEVIKGTKKVKNNPHSSVLNSYLVCGACGGKLSKGRHTNEKFKCPNQRYTDDTGCQNVVAMDTIVQKVVLNAINKQIEIADKINIDMKKVKKAAQEEQEKLQEELKSLKREVKILQDKKVKLYEDFVNEKLDKKQYQNQKSQINQQLNINETLTQDIKTQITTLKTKQTQSQTDNPNLNQNQTNNPNLNQTPTQLATPNNKLKQDTLTKDLLKAFIKQIIITPKKEINIIWNFKNNNQI